ncbi:hypothetical protein AURDEDRAFT_129470 [Auricularia subglabra TFB-10046 SS5]|nr:hypothetical protein AURDEDRAFT_129470 [Auricularia subglabra TFB-10046 SS5]
MPDFYLRDRLAVLHVSRAWRWIAFAFPNIWARLHVDVVRINTHRLVDLLLSSTTRYPVDFDMTYRIDQALSSAMVSVIEKHLGRFRSIRWRASAAEMNRLCSPAPLLEHLDLSARSLLQPIPPTLLGGVPGRLQSLELSILSLPPSCPALETVRSVKATVSGYPEHNEHLHRLFDLCPNIESLELKVVTYDAELFPRGPAPRSLRRVRLKSVANAYCPERDYNPIDLVALCESWQVIPSLDELVIVSFIRWNASLEPCNTISPILERATAVEIGRGRSNTSTRITTALPGNKHRMLCLRHRESLQTAAVARLLADCTPGLAGVVDFATTSDFLHHFTRAGGGLPSLITLSVAVYPGDDDVQAADPDCEPRYRWTYPWRHLAGFPPLPLLETLDVLARKGDEDFPDENGEPVRPDRSDAEALLTKLATASRQLLRTTIRGFPPDVAGAVDVPSAETWSVTFV